MGSTDRIKIFSMVRFNEERRNFDDGTSNFETYFDPYANFDNNMNFEKILGTKFDFLGTNLIFLFF